MTNINSCGSGRDRPTRAHWLSMGIEAGVNEKLGDGS